MEKNVVAQYPQGPMEIIKYMAYLPEDDELRMNTLMAYMNLVIQM